MKVITSKNNIDYKISYWIRILHFIFDFLVYLLISLLIYALAKFINPSLIRLNWTLIFTIIYFLYYFIFEVSFLKTPAKFLTNSKVFDLKTNFKPTITQIFIRTIVRIIPIDGFFVFFKNKLCLHDILSRTAVIHYRKTVL
jgi:uncharacterized RDD family membrane protein YckC